MATKKTSEYAALPGGAINPGWLYDIASAGTLNYKGTQTEVSQNVADTTITGLDTTAVTLKTAINEVKASVPVITVNSSNPSNPYYFAGLVIDSDGKTAFTISTAPGSNETFKLYLNGVLTADYTLTGTSLTWTGISLVSPGSPGDPDEFTAIINDGGVGAPAVTSVFTRTGAITAQSGDYTVAQVTGAAASGANSDITSLSGLTTPLSIAQGGTNSGTALTNDKVMISSGGNIIESPTITTSELNLLNGFLSVSTGTADNDKLVTQGYVDDKPGTILCFGANNVGATTVTKYLFPSFGDSAAPATIVNFVVPFSGTIRNMYVYHNVTAGNGNNIVYTLLQNATPSSLTVTIASTTQTASDLVNAVSVSAGDRLTIQVTKSLSVGTSPSDIYVTMEIK